MYQSGDKGDREIRSNTFDNYIDRKKRHAQQNEWKNSGSGAVFAGTYRPGSDAESMVRSTKMEISCMRASMGSFVYSMSIDDSSGIYTKSNIWDTDSTEGFIISDASDKYGSFDVKKGRYAVSVGFAGEAHIGIIEKDSNGCRLITDGQSREENPVWDKNGVKVYCQSCGLAEGEAAVYDKFEEYGIEMPYSPYIKGPYSIISIDTETGDINEIIDDDECNYVKPYADSYGNLYFIRYPYSEEDNRPTIKSRISTSVKVAKGFFGIMKAILAPDKKEQRSKRGNTKTPDVTRIALDGNIIEVEKALEENRQSGEKYPGVVPRSFELCKMKLDTAELKVVKSGVIAYAVDEKDGSIYYSNGNGIIKLFDSGDEEKISSAGKVTFIGLL